MSIAQQIWQELEQESVATRKVLERMPSDKFDWAPHEKSLTLGRLAEHVADLPEWLVMTLNQDSLDVSDAPKPESAVNADQLVAIFDKKMAAAKAVLDNTPDATFEENWKMTMGDTVLIDLPKGRVLRRWVLNHIVHHRAQLTVYLRLNDIPVPAVYGSSADEQDI